LPRAAGEGDAILIYSKEMKCELCHHNEAEVAISVTRDGGEDELYVCKECARRERVSKQKKSQRTRKVTGLPPGVSMSITEVGGGDVPPPIIEALMDAVGGIVGEIEKHHATQPTQAEKYHTLPCERAEERYRIGSRLHLEGLHLIGEMEAVHRAMRALDMRLQGVEADGVRDAGHVFELQYRGASERAKRVAEDLLAQERNARVRLFEEMPRVFGDSLCRALAILKNCRLLSPGELFDILSPLRLAAYEDMLDGIALDEIRKIAGEIDLGSKEDDMEQAERDRVDAARADEMNARFEDVVLNERAEEKFL